MVELLWWPVLFALPLPWLLRLVLPRAAESGGQALKLPIFAELSQLAPQREGIGSQARLWLPLLAWAALCFAAARPQWVGEVQAQPRTGRDLMLAVDVSGSMAAEDMEIAGRAVNRLDAVKLVLGDFLERRVGDRVGLILFGQQAYQLTPLTFDRASVRYQLDTSVVGIAGRETAIGDAIGLSVKRLRERPADQRVLILLTDGVNTTGALDPDKAAQIAATEGVRVHTIAFGGGSSSRSVFGLALPGAGAQIDESALKRIAQSTGGRFFRARDTSELAGIYAELDRLEPAAQEGEKLRPRDELFMWPLALAGVFALLALVGVGTARREEIAA